MKAWEKELLESLGFIRMDNKLYEEEWIVPGEIQILVKGDKQVVNVCVNGNWERIN